MTVPLLATKLYVPSPRARRVPRPRLVARLRAGLEQTLTLISAPAGFGKTTLLAECLAGCGVPAAWLSLDSADNDPTRFWTYVVAAMQTVPAVRLAGVGRVALGLLASAGLANPPPPIEAILAGLINELAGLNSPFTLVLDDLHLVTGPHIHAGLTFLLDHLPPPPRGLRLVVATRVDPPWPLARLRARGQMTELRAADLRFTPEESAEFLNTVMELDLPAGALAALDGRVEGWIAGLQMAALSLQGHRRRKGDTALADYLAAFTGSHRFVLDYLLEEVLDQQSPAIQEFLLKTAILERMSAPVCDALLDPLDLPAAPGEAGPSRRILRQIEEANLFVVPLDEERQWYRYHHLFADLLAQRLKRRYGDEVPALHLRASAWFERQGMIGEAVGHALAAGDVERVAGLVESHTLLAIMHGRLATVLGWLSALPEEVTRSRPWLSIGQSWALASAGQWDAVEPLLAAAEALILRDPAIDETQARRIMGHIVVIRSYGAAIKGELARARELAMLSLEMVPRSDTAVYGFAANMLGAALRHSGELAEAERVWTVAAAAGRAAGDLSTELPLLNSLASLQLEMGRLRAVQTTTGEALRRCGEAAGGLGLDMPLLSPFHTRLSRLKHEWNDLQAALRHAREGVRLAEAWGHAEAVATSCEGLALAHQALGDTGAAVEAMRRARQVAAGLGPWYDALTAADEAHLWLLQGNLEAALRWAGECRLESEGELEFSRVRPAMIRARVLLAADRPDEALAMLTRLLGQVEPAGAAGWEIEILALQALAFLALARDTEAVAALARALVLAEPEGYLATFLDEGEPMRRLLLALCSAADVAAGARSFRALTPYATRLLSAFPTPALPDTASAPKSLKSPLDSDTYPEGVPRGGTRSKIQNFPLEPLSDRELEVLRLLDTGLTTPEIAAELIVAVSTVRSHVKSIYGKLDAHSRIEAVHVARAMGLLP